MELLEKLPDVTVKGDGAEIVKHVSCCSAKQIMEELFSLGRMRHQPSRIQINPPECSAGSDIK
jgi:hypothetical protein